MTITVKSKRTGSNGEKRLLRGFLRGGSGLYGEAVSTGDAEAVRRAVGGRVGAQFGGEWAGREARGEVWREARRGRDGLRGHIRGPFGPRAGRRGPGQVPAPTSCRPASTRSAQLGVHASSGAPQVDGAWWLLAGLLAGFQARRTLVERTLQIQQVSYGTVYSVFMMKISRKFKTFELVKSLKVLKINLRVSYETVLRIYVFIQNS